VGLSQEQVADRADLSKNFVSAMEQGAKGFGMESFPRYVQALGISPGQALRVEGEADAGAAILGEEEHQFIRGYRRLSASDRERVRQCVTYLQDPHEAIRTLARQQLHVLERVIYAERLKAGGGVSPQTEPPPAG
jgi:transcriptional regulator with XRE-family HTH domain